MFASNFRRTFAAGSRADSMQTNSATTNSANRMSIERDLCGRIFSTVALKEQANRSRILNLVNEQVNVDSSSLTWK